MIYSMVLYIEYGSRGFDALYFKMLCRIYAWKVRLGLCIYVFIGVGGHAGGGLQHGVAPFWVHFILISGAQRALSPSFTLVELTSCKLRPPFELVPSGATGWRLEVDSCKLSPTRLEAEISSFAPFAFRLYNWTV